MNSLPKGLLAKMKMEYLLIDGNLHILESSEGADRFADSREDFAPGNDVRLSFPEFFGAEKKLAAVLNGEQSQWLIPAIGRFTDTTSPLYFDIQVLANEVKGHAARKHLLVIFQDVTERLDRWQKLLQGANEENLLLNDMLWILNQLRIGTTMTDRDGRVTFLSQTCQPLLSERLEDILGRQWEQVYPFKEEDKIQLRTMFKRPLEQRTKVPVHIEVPSGQHYWMEIEVQDDPRDSQGKIFFFYDMSEVHNLRRLLDEKAQFHELIGKSKPMTLIYQRIREVAQVDATALIEGETGTGKELVARAIHASSHRKAGPFIAINCAGLTDSLVESQLFGHKRGSFTGALTDHQGLFEAANGGTLLLDEIGDISLTLQTNLLRVLETREITRIGESRLRKVDVRVLAATNRNLSEEMEKGNFRADLFYRLRVARINLPALRERREDIPLLVGFFLSQSRAATGKPVQEVSHEAMRLLLEYRWPGNVRELKNAIEFTVIHCGGPVIHAEDLPPELIEAVSPGPSFDDTPQDERERLTAALERARGNRTAAARLLGISRATLYRHLEKFGIM